MELVVDSDIKEYMIQVPNDDKGYDIFFVYARNEENATNKFIQVCMNNEYRSSSIKNVRYWQNLAKKVRDDKRCILLENYDFQGVKRVT